MIDPVCAPVAFQITVDPGAGLKACVFRGVIETVAVVAHFVVGHVPVVSWLLVTFVDHEVFESVGVVHCHP